ncbi:hypothetical protein EJ02DRAFT_78300 [Clathrospora elynae]|uniref:RING-type domain-containing protein n=1 Tax=Clathrospora elynae TaxID=706981 RepID=A0A6A5SXU7_9PLEO|nr:hypothetical protein EJ02DRAFT_78300 [Clathrospora elynae]
MSYFTKREFLRSGTNPFTTTHATGTACEICYEQFPSTTPHHLKLAQYLCSAAKSLFSRPHQDPAAVFEPRANFSRRNNSMKQIKACGHAFCSDCLNRWLDKKNTCPMCRKVLFFVDLWSGYYELGAYGSLGILGISGMNAQGVLGGVASDVRFLLEAQMAGANERRGVEASDVGVRDTGVRNTGVRDIGGDNRLAESA